MQVRCPHCQTSLRLDESSSLAAVDCENCGSSFSIVGDDTLDFRSKSDTTERAAPRRVGHFELLEVVGRGAFGTVWRASDLELQRTVAVKIPRQDKLDPDEAEKFLREARAVAQLHHPNIVAVHEVGREDDAVYIVSDFVKGVTLSQWLSSRDVTPRDAAKLGAKIANALDHAHQAGVIHRDLKPSNVMLDEHDEPFIMDFGLAKREANDATMTMDGYVMGTPSYMPPEQARGQAHHADQRSDVYSLGAILFELLTGEKPFRGNAQMVLQQVLNDDAPHPRRLDSRIPEDLDTICLKCLEKSPAKRYETASELADELRRFLNHEPIHARRITSVARAWRWGKRNPAVSVLAIGLLVALLVGLAGVTTQWLRADHHAQIADEKAEKARLAAESEREAHAQTGQTLYVSHMNMVQHAFELRDSARMISILDLHRNYTDDDPRGFEWYYWWRTSHPWKKSFDGHVGSVFAVAVSGDGSLVASAGMDRVVQVRDTATGKEVAALDAHEQAVFALVFSPDATKLASAGRDGVIRIWSLHDGIEVAKFAGHERSIFSLAFSPDGKLLASCGADLLVRLWNADSGERLHELSGHFDFVYTVTFSPDGKHIASAGLDRTVRVWKVESGERVLLIEGNKKGGHVIEVWSVAFSPDGKTLATASGDKTIKLWEVTSGDLIDTLEGHSDRVRSLLFTDSGRKLLSVGHDRTLRLWDLTAEDPELPVPVRRLNRTPIHFFERMTLSTGKLVRTLPAHAGPVLCIAASKDGDVIATGGDDGKVKLWELSEIERTDTFDEHKRSVNCVVYSPDGSKLATAGNDKSVRLRDAATGKTIDEPLWHDERVFSLDFSPDGKQLASGDAAGNVVLWGLEGRERRNVGSHERAVSCVAFSPDGKLLATASHDGRVKLWDVATGVCLQTLTEHKDRLYSVKFVSAGKQILSAGSEGEIILWNTADGKLVRRIQAHDKRIWALAASPSANVIASASDDRSIKLWSLDTGECLGELRGHAESVLSLTFSPDGQTLVSGSSDKTIKLWDMNTGEPKTTLKGHRYRVWSVAFSPDGWTLASSSYVLKLWRAAKPDEKSGE